MNNFNKNTSPQGPKGSGEKHKFINKNINLKNKNIVKIKIRKGICDYNKLKKLTILIKDLKYKN